MSKCNNSSLDLEYAFLNESKRPSDLSFYTSRINNVNITSTFTGIGYIILDINSVVYTALDQYSLSKETIPAHTISEHLNYLIDNLASHSLKYMHCFYEFVDNPYINSIISILIHKNSGIVFKNYTDFNQSMEDVRIALVLSSYCRSSLNEYCSRVGMYVGMLDTLFFMPPFAYCNVVRPYDRISAEEYTKYKYFNTPEYNSGEVPDISKVLSSNGFTIESMNEQFDSSELRIFTEMKNNIEFPEDIFKYNILTKGEKLLFDGRIFHGNFKITDGETEFLNSNILNNSIKTMNFNKFSSTCSINTGSDENHDATNNSDLESNASENQLTVESEIKPDENHDLPEQYTNGNIFKCAESEIPWSGKDLDLIMSAVIDKISMRHLANIQRSAKSMHDGKFQYSSIVRKSSEPLKKISAKMQKIMDDNEARIRKEKEKTDNMWLRGFFNNYSKMPSLKAKRDYVENLKIENDYINNKLSLLKIELYSDIWNLEKRSENIDERVLVPLYLACLGYVEKNAINYDRSEMEFVLTKLVEASFEATVHELIEKHGLKNFNLPFKSQATSAPNDLDLYFQLKFAGEHLKRTLGTTKDRRVPFDPDKWQVQLLNLVDQNKSAIVAAPTSCGKTFICFYAIEKILRSSDTDVVVFCLPTKALVNQVSADVYARFTPKNVKTMLQGTLMNDRSNEPFNCQVLITIPAMLESLLTSRDCSNIKYIIIDEVHKINDESLGLKLERIIHLSKAPLLLLSATIGNLDVFYNWFKAIENKKGRDCELVTHFERFCELKTFVYKEKETIGTDENNIPEDQGVPSNDNTVFDNDMHDNKSISPSASACNTYSSEMTGDCDIVPLNCMIAYSHSHLKNFGFGNDLNFLPEELLNIYYYIYMALNKDQKKLIKSLAPKNFFTSNIICKADVKRYERHLLSTFEQWVKDGVLDEQQVNQVHSLIIGDSYKSFPTDLSEDYLVKNILALLMKLKDENMLPVIVFNTDRELVTRLARAVFNELERQDAVKRKDRAVEKMKKEAKRNRDAEKTKDSWIEDSIMSEQNVEPETRDMKYTFLDPITKLTEYEVKEEFASIRSFPKDILDMAHRGIGIHHSALSKKYRSAVEILFRKKHVRVLFATETLALGINMPCRTVVFAGDSLQLDPMNYKQMSGRAGRRGYDTLGNVVFLGIPKTRVQNLLVSMLPHVQGAYSFSNTSFVSFGIEESLLNNPLISTSFLGNDVYSGGCKVSNLEKEDSTSSNIKHNTSNHLKGNLEIKEDSNPQKVKLNTSNEIKGNLEIKEDSRSNKVKHNEIHEIKGNLEIKGDSNSNQLRHSKTSELDNHEFNMESLELSLMSPFTFNLLNSKSGRSSLLSLQKTLYPFIFKPSYLWDLAISNRDFDPAIFVFALLFTSESISWTPNDFMLTIAHLFEVRPYCVDPSLTLPPLPSKTRSFLSTVNQAYIESVCPLYSPRLRILQSMSSRPLHYIKSFLYFLDVPKNSYILDFFNHGNPVKIMNVNHVSQGELWQSLFEVDNFMKSLMRLLETYFNEKDERLKKLKIIHSAFLIKFESIFA